MGLLLKSLVIASPLAMAGPVNVPNDFTAGTPARAAEVNGNFSAIETAVNDNDSRILDNATAIQTGLSPVVLDGNDVEIGQLVSIGENHISIEVITPQGYLLNLAPNPGIQPVNSLVSLFFTSSDCTGTAYAVLTFGGYVISSYDLTGVPSLYYVDKNSAPVSGLSFASMTTSGGCSVVAYVSSGFPVLPNDSTVTGVSTDSYQLPIKIQRP